MGTVNFSGTGTGIDWDVIIEAEIQARTNRTITPLAEWKESWETKISTFALLKSYMSDLLSAVEDIDSSDELRSYAAQSSSTTTVEASVSSTDFWAVSGTMLSSPATRCSPPSFSTRSPLPRLGATLGASAPWTRAAI